MLENFRAQKIIWDRANKKIFEKLEANSGDSNGRKLVVQVINQEVSENLSGTTLSLGWKHRNGAKGLDAFNLIDASKGIFEIYYTTEMLSNVGNIEASLILIDSTGRIESNAFTISVRPSTVDDEAVESENSFTALTEALVKVNDFESQLAQKADKSEIGAPTQEQVNAWLEANPDATTTVRDGAITTIKLANKAVSNDKLNPTYNEKGAISSGSLNDLLETGTYLVTAAVTDNPLGAVGSFLIVETGATGIVVQYVTRLNTSDDLYFRTLRMVSGVTTFYDWRKVNFSENTQLLAGTDLNTVTASGDYLLSGSPINAPSGLGVSMLKVMNVNNWVTQTISKAANPNELYIRSFYISSGVASSISQWASIGRDLINRQLTTGEDLNTVLAEGTYLALASNPNVPSGAGAGLLVVKRQGLWIIQDYTSVTDPNLSFKRTTNESGSIRSNWEQIVTKSTLASSASLGLAGKTVVNFGDSIFGNVRGASSVSQAIADNSGAEVLNVAFGGAFASQRPDADWNEMTFYKLSDCVSSGDYSSLNREQVRSLRNYFGEHIDKLMSINWNDVDIITLAYGTNDFTGYKTLDNTNDKFDVDTYGGALRYGLRNIMTAYPHLKVLIITPIYRYYLDEEGNFIEDSDTRTETGGSFKDFVEKAMEIAQEFKVPYLNAHDKLGINRYNKDIYFNAPDTTHPNPTGNKKYGELIARKLIAGS